MAGVLFWVALIGGAAACPVKPNPRSNSTLDGGGCVLGWRGEGESVQDRKQRRWFTALSVRCSILLAFEHEAAVVGGLRRCLSVLEMCDGGIGGGVLGEVREGGGREGKGRLEAGKRGSEGLRWSEGAERKDRARGKRRRVDEGVVVAGMELASGW
jgi:hypothetical protein